MYGVVEESLQPSGARLSRRSPTNEIPKDIYSRHSSLAANLSPPQTFTISLVSISICILWPWDFILLICVAFNFARTHTSVTALMPLQIQRTSNSTTDRLSGPVLSPPNTSIAV